MKFKYTPEMDAFLIKHTTMPRKELTELFNAEFWCERQCGSDKRLIVSELALKLAALVAWKKVMLLGIRA